ncbi:MAG: WbqC family protein [Candidatus Sericytochromatia bacterium]|nr:WbqC family protein [Candidatus Sericytochromatia bacterium]
MVKRIAILQSNYIPWKGYFDLISSADEFIMFDSAQYTKRDWRSRNIIKTPRGPQWITVPVVSKGSTERSIKDIEIDGFAWNKSHWRSLEQNYRRAAHFNAVASWLEPLYFAEQHTHLSPLNRRFIEAICGYLGITTQLRWSWEYELVHGKTARLVHLCQQAGATTYISGPAAKAYLDEAAFTAAGIAVEWFDYSGYPEYPQLWGPFTHHVTVLDVLFNCGERSRDFLRRLPSR